MELKLSEDPRFLVGAALLSLWVGIFVLGFLHGQGYLMPEPENTFVHTTRDWLVALPAFLVTGAICEGAQRWRK